MLCLVCCCCGKCITTPAPIHTPPSTDSNAQTRTCRRACVHSLPVWGGPGGWGEAGAAWIFLSTAHLFIPVEFYILGRDYVFKKTACLAIPHPLRPPLPQALPPLPAAGGWRPLNVGTDAWCSAASSGAGLWRGTGGHAGLHQSSPGLLPALGSASHLHHLLRRQVVSPLSDELAHWPRAGTFSTLWPEARGVPETHRAS